MSSNNLSLSYKIACRLLATMSKLLGASARIKVVGDEYMPKSGQNEKGGMVLLWHATTVLPIYRYRNRGYMGIISESKDGELQNSVMLARGYRTIRGSTGNDKHGARALLMSIRALKDGAFMAITPDGPKGPVKKVQPGVVRMIKKSDCYFVPMGVAIDRCWRLKSWDSHMIPKPFCKTVIYVTEPVRIPEDMDEEQAAVFIEGLINNAENKAWEVLGK